MSLIFLFMLGCGENDLEQKDVIQHDNDQQDNDQNNPSDTQEPEELPDDNIEEEQEELPNIITEDIGENSLDGEEFSVVGRKMKRMTIPQISHAMRRVSGGIEWGGNSSLWDEYSDILGVPDYQNTQDEDRSPSIMFQKFLNDAATYTCQTWVENEISGESVLLFEQNFEDTTRPAVQANIQQFRWQIQGKVIDNSSQDQQLLNDYENLFFTVLQRSSSSTEAWTTICIAMFSHPDFFYY